MKSRSPMFMKFVMVVQHLCQMSLLTFERSRSMFKVKEIKVKTGAVLHENLPLAIAAGLRFEMSSQNLAIRQK